MQSAGRCPRCGYVLIYDGFAYYCSFCGYPRTRPTLTGTLHSWEENVKAGINRVLQEFKPKQRQITYYPVNVAMQPCDNCGFNFPRGTLTCPSCGTPRQTIPQSTQPPATTEQYDVDRRVLDYITAHGGTISLSQAAQDLTINQPVLLSAIERLKARGFLNES